MRPTGNLLALAGLGRNIYLRWRSQRLLSSVIVVAGLIWITSALVSALLIGGFYAAYQGFLFYGYEPLTALFYVAAMALALTAILIVSIRFYARRLFKRMPATNRVTETVDAFLDGLMAD
jgi:hypothetical protein